MFIVFLHPFIETWFDGLQGHVHLLIDLHFVILPTKYLGKIIKGAIRMTIGKMVAPCGC